jgi:hypothetical protein
VTRPPMKIVRTNVTQGDLRRVQGSPDHRDDATPVWVQCPAGYDAALITAADVLRDPAVQWVAARDAEEPAPAVERAVTIRDCLAALRTGIGAPVSWWHGSPLELLEHVLRLVNDTPENCMATAWFAANVYGPDVVAVIVVVDPLGGRGWLTLDQFGKVEPRRA